jgi:ethanolamine ammonia-lyase small subunit
VTPDPWEDLRSLTSARIALGRAGGSLPTRALLEFQLAHARARDAVHADFDAAGLAARLRESGLEVVTVSSAAPDRQTYLQRPDLGRQLDDASRATIAALPRPQPPPELALIIADGLSAVAAERQAPRVVEQLLPRLTDDGWRIAPLVVARFARVAIEDEIGALLGATMALILIGERPGLGSPDSLGAYLVYGPRSGLSDADRNCVSNIRPEGLTPAAAAETLHYLLTESRRRRLSGVALKDERARLAAPRAAEAIEDQRNSDQSHGGAEERRDRGAEEQRDRAND